MTEDQVKDLVERLEKANREIGELAANSDTDYQRLHGKAEGVRLALSYLKEYQ